MSQYRHRAASPVRGYRHRVDWAHPVTPACACSRCWCPGPLQFPGSFIRAAASISGL